MARPPLSAKNIVLPCSGDLNGEPTPLGPSNPMPTGPGAAEDVVFDHAHGVKASVTTSASLIVPPAGCKYLRLSSDVDLFVNTAGAAAVDDGSSIRVVANVPEVIPVVAGTAVFALSSSGTATVRATPFKPR